MGVHPVCLIRAASRFVSRGLRGGSFGVRLAVAPTRYFPPALPASTPLVEMKYFTSMLGFSHAGRV